MSPITHSAPSSPVERSATEGSAGAGGFPGGAEFAFTIIDDTDDSTLTNVGPMYRLLADLGLRTTKTVWPLGCPEGSADFWNAETLESAAYLEFCRGLVAEGFEVTWHCATMETSNRARTVAGLERFREVFGRYPTIHANHAHNRENVYWGAARYQSVVGSAVRLFGGRATAGHEPGTEWFWGDLCAERVEFVRNFAFRRINTLGCDPATPYQLPSTPYVRWWFSASDAPDCRAFNRLVTPKAIDRLRAERGACILATHLGKGFVSGGRVDPEVARSLRYLSSLPGWFVPVSDLLRFLRARSGRPSMTPSMLRHLELRHVLDRIGARLWR